MWIVRFALRLPHTFYVLAGLILVPGRFRDSDDANRYFS